MVSYYSRSQKSAGWYKTILFYILDIIVWNTYYIYKNYFKCPNLRFEDFIDSLIKNLIRIPSDATAEQLFKLNILSSRKSKNNELDNLHLQQNILLSNDYIRQKYFKNCIVCYKIKQRKQTSFQYKICKALLCARKCFEDLHTDKNNKKNKNK